MGLLCPSLLLTGNSYLLLLRLSRLEKLWGKVRFWTKSRDRVSFCHHFGNFGDKWGNSENKWYLVRQTRLSDTSNIKIWLYNVSEDGKVLQLISFFEAVIEKLDLIALYLSFCFSYFNLLYPNLISAPNSITLF